MSKDFNLTIKIKSGLKIRDPKTMALMECEKTYSVPPSQYWLRRLRDGDCVKVENNKIENNVVKKKINSKKKESKSLDQKEES